MAQQAVADIGLIGLAVMGENFALNIADHGYKVAVYNRTTETMKKFIARENPPGGLVGYHRQTPRWAGSVKALRLRGLPFLAADPNLFEEMVEPDFVVGGNGRAAVRRVGERAIERMARTMLRGVEV